MLPIMIFAVLSHVLAIIFTAVRLAASKTSTPPGKEASAIPAPVPGPAPSGSNRTPRRQKHRPARWRRYSQTMRGSFRSRGIVCSRSPAGSSCRKGDHIREVQIVDFTAAVVAGSTGIIQPTAQIDHCRTGCVFRYARTSNARSFCRMATSAHRTAASGCGSFLCL